MPATPALGRLLQFALHRKLEVSLGLHKEGGRGGERGAGKGGGEGSQDSCCFPYLK